MKEETYADLVVLCLLLPGPASMVGVSYTKANALIAVCEDLGILRQQGTGKRNRKFIYRTYVGILSEGTELSLNQKIFLQFSPVTMEFLFVFVVHGQIFYLLWP